MTLLLDILRAYPPPPLNANPVLPALNKTLLFSLDIKAGASIKLLKPPLEAVAIDLPSLRLVKSVLENDSPPILIVLAFTSITDDVIYWNEPELATISPKLEAFTLPVMNTLPVNSWVLIILLPNIFEPVILITDDVTLTVLRYSIEAVPNICKLLLVIDDAITFPLELILPTTSNASPGANVPTPMRSVAKRNLPLIPFSLINVSVSPAFSRSIREAFIFVKVTLLPVIANDAVEEFDTLVSMFVWSAELDAFNCVILAFSERSAVPLVICVCKAELEAFN